MTRPSLSLGILLLALTAAPAWGQSDADLIEQAVLPLPEALRDGATVAHYPARGQRNVLREGASDMICRLYSYFPQFYAQCHHRDLNAMFDRFYQILGQGTSSDDAAGILDAEIRAEQLSVNNGGVEYLLRGSSPENSDLMITITIPGATGASTGLPTEENGDEPWLMWAGTEVAHVMIPQN